mmetsp:Transcript_51359/g.116800  ORF Transcript_51359/g.116800 Transcript_51359/m.116800 type:complete len:305 (-) Transcript_51359:1708-2622(-)
MRWLRASCSKTSTSPRPATRLAAAAPGNDPEAGGFSSRGSWTKCLGSSRAPKSVLSRTHTRLRTWTQAPRRSASAWSSSSPMTTPGLAMFAQRASTSARAASSKASSRPSPSAPSPPASVASAASEPSRSSAASCALFLSSPPSSKRRVRSTSIRRSSSAESLGSTAPPSAPSPPPPSAPDSAPDSGAPCQSCSTAHRTRQSPSRRGLKTPRGDDNPLPWSDCKYRCTSWAAAASSASRNLSDSALSFSIASTSALKSASSSLSSSPSSSPASWLDFPLASSLAFSRGFSLSSPSASSLSSSGG